MNDDTFYTKLADMSDEEFAEEFMAQMDREGRVTLCRTKCLAKS